MKTILIALVFGLASSLAALAGEPDWVERHVDGLAVMLPSGEGWQLQQAEDGGGWAAARVRRTASGAPLFLDTIGVHPHPLPEIFWDWLPIEVATDYLMWEIENLEVEGVDTGQFTLPELDVYEEEHGGLSLHVLRNVKAYIDPWHPALKLEAQELYLVFLPDFAETTTFHKIFIASDCFFEDCAVEDLDLTAMYPVLDDLRAGADPPD